MKIDIDIYRYESNFLEVSLDNDKNWVIYCEEKSLFVVYRGLFLIW